MVAPKGKKSAQLLQVSLSSYKNVIEFFSEACKQVLSFSNKYITKPQQKVVSTAKLNFSSAGTLPKYPLE